MNEEPIDDAVEEVLAAPFDDFGNRNRGKRRLHLTSIAPILRILSGIMLAFAVLGAAGVIALDALHMLSPEVTWRYKSALPLIGIGSSYALLQCTIPRTFVELCLSIAVSLGFILWGVEQFVQTPGIASLVDDVVVFM